MKETTAKEKELLEGTRLKIVALECEIRLLEAQIDGLRAYAKSLEREEEVIEVESSSEEE